MKLLETYLSYVAQDVATRHIGDSISSLSRGNIGVSSIMLIADSLIEDTLQPATVSAEAESLRGMLSRQFEWRDVSFDGLLGFVFMLRRLEELEIITAPDNLSAMFDEALGLYSRYYRDMPIQYNPNDAIYPSGIVAISFCDHDDTIASYFRRENTIHLIRDCEKILTADIPYIHTPQSLTASQLHSILAFILEADKFKLFPYKTTQLRDTICSFEYDVKQSMDKDVFILKSLLGQEVPESVIESIKSDIYALAHIGLFSFIYRKPTMFSSLFDEEISDRLSNKSAFAAFPANVLIGCAFGLIANELYHVE